MSLSKKEKYYKQLHEQLAKEYSTTPMAIRNLRSSAGHGFSFTETKNEYLKRIKNKEETLIGLLKNINDSKETVRIIDVFSQETLKDILSRK